MCSICLVDLMFLFPILMVLNCSPFWVAKNHPVHPRPRLLQSTCIDVEWQGGADLQSIACENRCRYGPIVRGTKKGLQVSEHTKTLRKQRKYGSMVHFFG